MTYSSPALLRRRLIRFSLHCLSSRMKSARIIVAIYITVLCFNLLGDGLRDALDPKG